MFCLRIGGTNEFISRIDPWDMRCVPRGSCTSVVGKFHPEVMAFERRIDAEDASTEVLRIEGFGCCVEVLH